MTDDELNRRIHELRGLPVEAQHQPQCDRWWISPNPVGDVCSEFVIDTPGPRCFTCDHWLECHANIPDYAGSLDVTVAAIRERWDWADYEVHLGSGRVRHVALTVYANGSPEMVEPAFLYGHSEDDAHALAAAFCAALEASR